MWAFLSIFKQFLTYRLLETGIQFSFLFLLAPWSLEKLHSEIHYDFRLTVQKREGGSGGWKSKRHKSILVNKILPRLGRNNIHIRRTRDLDLFMIVLCLALFGCFCHKSVTFHQQSSLNYFIVKTLLKNWKQCFRHFESFWNSVRYCRDKSHFHSCCNIRQILNLILSKKICLMLCSDLRIFPYFSQRYSF